MSNQNNETENRYKNTMAALQQQESTLPVYSGSYDGEINELFNKISSRPAFSYSPSADPLYGAYRERYMNEGSAAMRDSMAQAASLTGGYGSTYSQSVGQQQFESYLSRLNDALPDLYSAAYSRYKDEDYALRRQMSLLSDMSEREYDRYHDSVTDDQNERRLSHSIENDEYQKLADLIYNYGYKATEEDLRKSGMSEAQAEALFKKYCKENGLNPDGSAHRSNGVNYYDYFDNKPAEPTEQKFVHVYLPRRNKV